MKKEASFIKFPHELLHEVYKLPTKQMILVYLVALEDSLGWHRDHTVEFSSAYVAKRTGLEARNTRRAIEALIASGHLVVIKAASRASGAHFRLPAVALHLGSGQNNPTPHMRSGQNNPTVGSKQPVQVGSKQPGTKKVPKEYLKERPTAGLKGENGDGQPEGTFEERYQTAINEGLSPFQAALRAKVGSLFKKPPISH